MKNKNTSQLLERYRNMLASGSNLYFDADEFDELAGYFEQNNDIDQAKDIVEMGLKIHPDNEYLKIRCAEFKMYDSDYLGALNYLNTYFQQYNFDQYLIKIECLLNLNLYAEAYELTKKIIADESTRKEDKFSELGFVYLESEYYDDAIYYFELYLEINTQNKDVLTDLIYAYEAKNNFEQAIRICNMLLDLDPYSTESWMMLGRLYLLIGKVGKALDAFDFVITIDGEDLNILKLKAHCFILSEQFTEAIELLQMCVKLSPKEEIHYLALIDCYLGVDRYNEALACISELEEAIGISSISMAKKALVYTMVDQIEEANLLIQDLQKRSDLAYESYIIIGDIYVYQHLLNEAELAYEKALLMQEETEVIEKMVSVCIENNTLNKAIFYQQKLAVKLKTKSSLERLSLLYLENGNKKDFISSLNSLDNDSLSHLYEVFYSKKITEKDKINREYLINRLLEAYNCRLLYKNIKY